MSLSTFAAEVERHLTSDRKFAFWEGVAIAAFVLGVVAILIFAGGSSEHWRAYFILSGALLLIALAAWTVGSVAGFLFGVPRFRSDGRAVSAEQEAFSRYVPNTNLEQVSDWLTKVIIGATLVQIQTIPRQFQSLCEWIADSLGRPQLAAVAGGILIYFGLAGFLWCYLWSSIRVMRELIRIAKEPDRAPAAKTR